MSDDLDDDTPYSPDAMLHDAPDLGVADTPADAAHEATLAAFAMEEETGWYDELDGTTGQPDPMALDKDLVM